MAAAGPILASFEDAFPGYATADISQVECSKALATHPDPRLYINAKHIVSSPYQNLTNQLNLQSLGKPHRLFALALMVLSPIRADFRSAPYMSIFNWPDLFHLLRALCMQNGVKWRRQEFYVVIFRSKLRQGIDRDRLGELDQRSHEEACASGGLLKYWFGVSDEDHRNLATCKHPRRYSYIDY